MKYFFYIILFCISLTGSDGYTSERNCISGLLNLTSNKLVNISSVAGDFFDRTKEVIASIRMPKNAKSFDIRDYELQKEILKKQDLFNTDFASLNSLESKLAFLDLMDKKINSSLNLYHIDNLDLINALRNNNQKKNRLTRLINSIDFNTPNFALNIDIFINKLFEVRYGIQNLEFSLKTGEEIKYFSDVYRKVLLSESLIDNLAKLEGSPSKKSYYMLSKNYALKSMSSIYSRVILNSLEVIGMINFGLPPFLFKRNIDLKKEIVDMIISLGPQKAFQLIEKDLKNEARKKQDYNKFVSTYNFVIVPVIIVILYDKYKEKNKELYESVSSETKSAYVQYENDKITKEEFDSIFINELLQKGQNDLVKGRLELLKSLFSELVYYEQVLETVDEKKRLLLIDGINTVVNEIKMNISILDQSAINEAQSYVNLKNKILLKINSLKR